jgi:hypothetical protein
VPLRTQRNEVIGVTLDHTFELSDSWTQGSDLRTTYGVRWVYNFTPSIALTTALTTNILLSHINCGVNWYWFDGPFTPYAYARGGVIMALGVIPVSGTSGSGVGVEYIANNGFTVGLGAGPAFFFGDFFGKGGGRPCTVNTNTQNTVCESEKEKNIFLFGEVKLLLGMRY